MRYAIAAACFMLSSPALATGGFLCTPEKGAGPSISLIIGNGIPGGVIGAAVKENGRWLSTMTPNDRLVLKQSWIDRQHTWVDIIHAKTGATEAQLRVRNQGFGGVGTLVRKGRTWKVRCRQD